MKRNLKKCVSVLTVFVLVLMLLLPSSVLAAAPYNGYSPYIVKAASGRLIIGDSRCCQLAELYGKSSSYVTTWGGSYYDDAKYQILSAGKLKRVQTCVTQTIMKTGKCKVFLFSTVNDYDGGDEYKWAVQSMMKNVKTIYNMTAKYRGKTVHPTIFVVNLVGSKGAKVSVFNNYLKAKVAANSYVKKYMSIRACMLGENGGYQKDNVHFNDQTLKSIMIYVRKQLA